MFVALARSRSTPGMVESTGRIPLENMVLSRTSTLPSGLMRSNQRRRSTSQDTAPSNSTPTGGGMEQQQDSMHSDLPITETSIQHVEIANVGTMTKSLTVSSMASLAAGTPPQKSPHFTDTKFTISPPPSPGIFQTLSPGSLSSSNAQYMSRSQVGMQYSHEALNQGGTPNQASPLHLAYQPSYPLSSLPGHQMNFLSPYCASNNLHHPTSQTLAMTRSDNLSSSQTHIASSPQSSVTTHSPFYQPGVLQQVSPGVASTVPSLSPGSFSYDTSQEVLLQEISSLRERLRSLETENQSMSVKLNQQQWNVEHRLNELEMHICQSSSVASTTSQEDRGERLEHVNRESII